MTRDAAQPSDVTILGAGIVGVCCALSALERGLSVTLIDRGDPGTGASHGNAGVISPWSCVPQCMPGVWKSVPRWMLDPLGPVRARLRDLPGILPWALAFLRNGNLEKLGQIADTMDLLMRDNVEVYKRYLAGTGSESLIAESWYVNVFRGNDRPDLDDLAWKLRIERGAPIEVVDRGDLLDIEPALSREYHSAVLIKGQARARAPGDLCRALAEKAFALGAAFRHCDVTALAPREDGRIRLETDRGEILANKLVLAGGIWSAELLAPLGVKLPLMAERGYHLEFVDPGVTVHNSIQDVAGKVVVSSMLGGLRAAGTAEFASVHAPANYKRAQAFKPLTKRLLPSLNTENARQWMGIRPSFPDNLPAIGNLPGLPNLLAAFGHSHYGMGMAPATGRIVADLLTGRPANADLSMVRPDRF